MNEMSLGLLEVVRCVCLSALGCVITLHKSGRLQVLVFETCELKGLEGSKTGKMYRKFRYTVI